jgi:hypothetical protein
MDGTDPGRHSEAAQAIGDHGQRQHQRLGREVRHRLLGERLWGEARQHRLAVFGGLNRGDERHFLLRASAGLLTGSSVTATLFNPNLTTILGGPATAIVGPTVEFPSGSIIGNSLFKIDITGDQIIYSPLSNVTYAAGAFNGFVFEFVGAPNIAGVTVDGTSTFAPTGLTFTDNSISMNLSGETVSNQSVSTLDSRLPPPPFPNRRRGR